MRVIPKLRSTVVSTAPSTGVLKLGQPVPLSNLVLLSNSGCPQAAQAESARPLLVKQRAAARPLGAVPAHDLVLLGGQDRPPFGVGVRYREVVLFHEILL